MPIYEYVCQTCTHRFEVRQKFSDPPVESCERCGKGVQRVISPPAIMFKGSGWYVTDYSDKLKAPAEGTANPAATNGNGGSATETKKESPAPSSSPSSPAPSTSSSPPAASTGNSTSSS